MHVRLSEVEQSFIKSLVQDGSYADETEVVRDAIRKMREERERAARFRAAVMVGDEAIERGETVPYSPELMEDIKRQAIRKAKNGKPYNSPDAIPQNS